MKEMLTDDDVVVTLGDPGDGDLDTTEKDAEVVCENHCRTKLSVSYLDAWQ